MTHALLILALVLMFFAGSGTPVSQQTTGPQYQNHCMDGFNDPPPPPPPPPPKRQG